MPEYSREQIYDAMRKADAAGDAEAVRALAAALQGGASKQEILAEAEQRNLSVDETALDANIAARDAGQQTNTFLPPEREPSTLEQIGQSTQNALAGFAQGVGSVFDLAMDVGSLPERGTNYLLRGAANVGDAVGLEGVANALRTNAEVSEQSLARRPTVVGAIENFSPTPEGMRAPRVAAQLLGGIAVPLGPKAPATAPVRAPRPQAASEAQQVVEAGEQAGVRVMTSDVRPPRGFLGKNARALGERIPFAGTGGARVKQNEERISAVKDLARDFGVEGSQEVIEEVADDLAKTRGGRLAALKARKDRVIQGIQQPFTSAPNTVRAINEQVRRLRGIDEVEYAPVIERLQRFGQQVTSGKTLEQVEGQRKLLGDLFADQGLASIRGEGQKAINAIYAPLRDDMGNFIKAQGGDEAFSAWKRSNAELATMAGELDAGTFKRVLQNAETTPENVASLLFSKKPSDVRRLYANLSPAGQEKAKGAVIYEAIRRAGGMEELSPQKFANALQSFGRTTGVIFKDDAPRVEGLVRLLKATQQASVAGAAPPTGVQNTVPVVAAILADWMGSAGAAMTTAGTAGLAARLYESRPVRNLLIGLSKTKPGSAQEGKMIERIGRALLSQGEIQSGNFTRAANMNSAGALVAGDGQAQD